MAVQFDYVGRTYEIADIEAAKRHRYLKLPDGTFLRPTYSADGVDSVEPRTINLNGGITSLSDIYSDIKSD